MVPSRLELVDTNDAGVEIFGQKWIDIKRAKSDLFRLVEFQTTAHNELVTTMNILIDNLRNSR